MKKLVDWFRGKITYEELCFAMLVMIYRLQGKVVLHIFQDGHKLTWALWPITKEDKELDVTLPESFVNRVKKLAKQCEQSWLKRFGKEGVFKFKVSSKGITLDEIRKKQQAWENHCQLFWSAID